MQENESVTEATEAPAGDEAATEAAEDNEAAEGETAGTEAAAEEAE